MKVQYNKMKITLQYISLTKQQEKKVALPIATLDTFVEKLIALTIDTLDEYFEVEFKEYSIETHEGLP